MPPRLLCRIAFLLEKLGIDCMARRTGRQWACPLYILRKMGVEEPREKFWWVCGIEVRKRCRSSDRV